MSKLSTADVFGSRESRSTSSDLPPRSFRVVGAESDREASPPVVAWEKPSTGSAQAGADFAEDARRIDSTRQEIQRLYREATRLAQAQISPTEFGDGLLDSLTRALGSVAARLWVQNRSGDWEQLGQACAPQFEHLAEHFGQREPSGFLGIDWGEDRAMAVAPPPQPTDQGPVELDACLRLLGRFSIDEQQSGVIEVFQRPGVNEATQRGYLRFVVQMADVAADYFRREQLRQYRRQETIWKEFEQFCQQLHGKLDRQRVAYALANEGRRLLNCDRVSVVSGRGRSCRVLAISGLDTFNSRSENVRSLRQLTRTILRIRQPFWYPHSGGAIPPQIDKVLHEYLDQSQARSLTVLPLFPPRDLLSASDPRSEARREPVGALVCEQLRTAQFEIHQQEQATLIARQAGLALANAEEHQGLFLLPVWKLLSKTLSPLAPRHLPKTLLLLVILCAVVCWLSIVPMDFYVTAQGKLLPTERRDVFAHVPGIISQVHARHADRVEEGQLLVTMRSTDIAVSLSELEGQRGRTVEQIFAKEQLLLRNSRLSPLAQDQIAGELDELKQALVSLEQRIELSREKEGRLFVRSPMTGEVVTWQVEDSLQHRPVSTGQVLMSIIDPDGLWELEIYLPERRLGHVIQTGEETTSPLTVQFQLSTHPGQSYQGEVVECQRLAELRGDQGNTIALRVAIRKEELPALHNETTATARIFCGRRAVGFVLFQDVIETVQETLAYHFGARGA